MDFPLLLTDMAIYVNIVQLLLEALSFAIDAKQSLVTHSFTYNCYRNGWCYHTPIGTKVL